MIPLSVPNISGNEWQYVKDCLDTGWISSVGSYVNLFEEKIAAFTGVKYAVAAMNGTAALHLSLQIAGVGYGDHVIVPNITFVASCNAVRYCGADPIFIDVCPDTWQMDLELLEEFLCKHTYSKSEYNQDGEEVFYTSNLFTHRKIAAIMPVHVLGNMANMNRLIDLCRKYNLTIVEDSTEALGSYFGEKHAGTFGLLGTFSFNGNKIISTGGGGMIITDDESLAKKAKHLTTQAKTDPFEYHHDETGYNYRLVNILAAVGVAQMEQLPKFLERKKAIDQYYREHLESDHLQFQKITEGCTPNNWLHTIKVTDQKGMIKHLLSNNIQCRPFWVPMNQLPMHKTYLYYQHRDISNQVYNSCISIPSSTNLTDAQVEEVVRVIQSFK